MAHRVDEVAAVVHLVAPDVDVAVGKGAYWDVVVAVDEHKRLETCEEAGGSRREATAAGRGAGSKCWRTAQAYARCPGKRMSAQLDLYAYACTACK